MKTLTIRNVTLQMDMPNGLTPLKYAHDMIDLVNLTLQREPHGLCAQIMNGAKPIRETDITVENLPEE